MNEKAAKSIRVFTVPPIFAAVLCALLYWQVDGAYTNGIHCLVMVFTLSVLPLMSYPLCAIIPALRRQGRKAERTMGLIFSVAGYIGGFAFALLTPSTTVELVIYGTYLLSGVMLAICTVCRFKASAHTCGCSGPVAALSVFVSPWFLLGYLLVGAVMWASVQLKRHSRTQLMAGSLIPVLSLLIVCGWMLGDL